MKLILERTSVSDYLRNPLSLDQYNALLREIKLRFAIHYSALLAFAVTVYFLTQNGALSDGLVFAICMVPALLLETWLFVRKPLVVNITNQTLKMPPWLTILKNDKAPVELEGEAGENTIKRTFIDEIKKQGRNALGFELDVIRSLDKISE